MALIAIGNQDGADLLLKEIVARRASIRRRDDTRGENEEDERAEPVSHRGDSADV